MRRAVLILGVFVAALPAAAGEPIVIGERVTLDSHVMGESRTLLISTPPGYEGGTDRYPVLVLTDGDVHLTHARGTVDFLALNNGLMPELIIVGVTNTNRNRDLTPTHGSVPRRDGRSEALPGSGGAGRFLAFITGEVLPYVDAHYRTQPYRILAGHSFGGLFALWAFFEHPEAFNATIAASPSLLWDHELPLALARTFFEHHEGSLPKCLFVSMGNDEEGVPRPNAFDRLRSLLAQQHPDGFVFGSAHLPEETHSSVVLRSYYLGLKQVFTGWALPRDVHTGAIAGALSGIDAHYAALGKRFGFAIEAPEAVLNLAGYQAMAAGRQERALELFRANVARHPRSANVHDSLGEALERSGKLEEAIACYEMAVALGRESGDRNTPAFELHHTNATGRAAASPPAQR